MKPQKFYVSVPVFAVTEKQARFFVFRRLFGEDKPKATDKKKK
jgi:hypothetical protein